jgi:hypothetical protein
MDVEAVRDAFADRGIVRLDAAFGRDAAAHLRGVVGRYARLVDRYRSGFAEPPGGGKGNWHPFLRRHPPLGDLLRAATRPDRGRSMVGERYEIDGVPVDVVELTGAPGDVVITHLHVFHSGSPNTSESPRYMLGKGVLAA